MVNNIYSNSHAGVAQLVERDLAKVEVASSSLVTRFFIRRRGRVVRQRPAKPCTPVQIRTSPFIIFLFFFSYCNKLCKDLWSNI